MSASSARPSPLLTAATVLAFLVGLAGVTVAVYELGQARRAWGSLKVARTEYATEQAQSRILERTTDARGKEVGALEKAARESGAMAAPLAGAPSGGAPDSGWDQTAEMQLFLNANPQMRELIASFAKGQFQAIFGAFVRTANLSPGQVDQLEAAI